MLYNKAMLVFLSLSCSPPSDTAITEVEIDIVEELRSVGNIEDDRLRYDALENILSHMPEGEEREELVSFLSIYEQWAYGKERHWVPGDQDSAGEDGYLGGFFVMNVLPNQG